MVPSARGPPARNAPGPRACGDGPWWAASSMAALDWSPRVRGWSRARAFSGASPSLVPARAGMVPCRTTPCASPTTGPRACGDGPSPGCARAASGGWSPRVRGWPRLSLAEVTTRTLVPARAGMVPTRPGGTSSPLPGPRACGDGPHPRDRCPHRPLWPRARGDGPADRAQAQPTCRWSPHARGCSRGRHDGGSGLAWSPRTRGLPPSADSPRQPQPPTRRRGAPPPKASEPPATHRTPGHPESCTRRPPQPRRPADTPPSPATRPAPPTAQHPTQTANPPAPQPRRPRMPRRDLPLPLLDRHYLVRRDPSL